MAGKPVVEERRAESAATTAAAVAMNPSPTIAMRCAGRADVGADDRGDLEPTDRAQHRQVVHVPADSTRSARVTTSTFERTSRRRCPCPCR